MKNVYQKLLPSIFAASALAVSAIAPVAHAEVSASVGAANMYYWRGFDLGTDANTGDSNGDAAIWGDINYSESGFYAGMWASSGDATMGTEYDLYLGYGFEAGPVGIDVSYWSYSYPSAIVPVSPGDLAEILLGVSLGPVTLTHYEGIEDLEDYTYDTLEISGGKFSAKYGVHEFDYAHLDLTYAYNDNVSFTLGLVTDDVDDTFNNEPKFVVNFTVPIGE